MHARIMGAAVLLAAALAFTGCAAQPTDPASPGGGDRTSTPGATPAPTPVTPAGGAYLDYTDGAIETTAGQKVLFFHATWCPKCRQLDEELRSEGAPDGLTVFKVDYDSRTDLRQKYGVTLQTTVVFVDDRGELISSTVLYGDPSIASLLAAMP